MNIKTIQAFSKKRRLMAAVILVGGTLLSLVLIALVLLNSIQQNKRAMERETQDLFDELNISLNATHGDLVELEKLLSLAPGLSKPNFDSVVPQLLANKPERRMLAWLPRIDRGALESYRAQLKEDNPDSDIDPQLLLSEQRADPVWPGNILPVRHVALQPGEAFSIGRDMLSNKEMQAAIMHAVDTNTPGLIIKPSMQGPSEKGLYLFEPVYAVSLVPRNIKERREKLVGVIMLKIDTDLWLAQHVPADGTEVLIHTEDMHSVFQEKKTFFGISQMNHMRLVDEKLYVHASRSIDWSQLDFFSAILMGFISATGVWLSHRLLRTQYALSARLAARNRHSEDMIDTQRDQLLVQDSLLHQQKKVMDEHSIISVADITGRITYTNHKFCEISGYSQKELIGQNHRIVNSGQHPVSFFKHMWKTISSGKSWSGVICNKAKDGSLYWVDSIIKPFFDEKGRIDHYISIRTDITAQMNAQKMLSCQRQLLDMVQNSMRYFVQVNDLRQLANSIIKELCTLTQSEFALIGEVLYDEHSEPYLKIHAISDISWNDASYKLYLANMDKGMEFHNLENVLTRPIATGNAYISNDVANDEYAGGQPMGHPAIRNYLGVPIYSGTEVVGMYGVANNDAGYDEKLLAYLRPFTAAYGVMISAARTHDKERAVQLEMIDAKNAAETANHAKSEFLSRMSHELRTPLNAILGFGQLLKTDAEQPLTADQQENVDEILQAGKHLLRLISEILDLSRIESGDIQLDLRKIKIRNVLEECRGLIAPLANQRNISINMDIAECESLKVKADFLRLKQVILNLLSNAVKYNKHGGSVLVHCAQKDKNRLVISVTDTGKGIAAHFHQDVFKPFRRMDAATSGVEGVGIGLVISRRFIETMGGKIDFESVEGEGSTFRIEIECVADDEASTPEIERELQVVDTREVNSSGDARVYKMLYVEDNKANLRLMEHLMRRRKDIEMIGAETGEQGVECAISERPDIILMDINLPGINGYEALAQIRLHPELDSVPVMALSANAMPGDIENGLNAGFSGYVTKPLDARKFIEVLNATIKEIETSKPVTLAQ